MNTTPLQIEAAGSAQKSSEPKAKDGLLVRCNGIEKSFGQGQARIKVLRGTDFEARSAEMTFLVGPSGCGKTTLISIIGAILSCEEGGVEVMGQNLRTMSRKQLADFRLAHFGFIFQQFNLLPSLSAIENASIPLVARGESTRVAEKKASELLGELGLGDHSQKMPNQLSGGQQQRVAIARALVHGPDVVICDEPTASLDATSGHTVMELLRDLSVQGDRSVIVVTHDDRIYEFADRIHHMSDGVIERIENPSQSFSNNYNPQDASKHAEEPV